jgi:hypothetical protein
MKHELAGSLGGPRAAVPVLLPEGARLRRYGRQEATRDWVYFHLGRPARGVTVPEALEANGDGSSLYLARTLYLSRLEDEARIDVVTRTKAMALVRIRELGPRTGRGGAGG